MNLFVCSSSKTLLWVFLFLAGATTVVVGWNVEAKNWSIFNLVDNSRSSSSNAKNATVAPNEKAKLGKAFGNLPVSFEANQGQANPSVKYLARGKGYQLLLSPRQSALTLQVAGSVSETIEMKLVGGNTDPMLGGEDGLPGVVNYLWGSNPQAWKTNIPTFAKIRYQAVYPGIDLVYYGKQNQLEYDFIVAPQANPHQIAIDFGPTKKLKINRAGELVIQTQAGELRQLKPVIYQMIDGARHEISGQYLLRGKHQVRFRVGKYDRSQPLIIDPVLVYSTFLGGSNADQGLGIAVDTNGSAYITGDTVSTNFLVEAPLQGMSGGATDAFVVKLNATGTALLYATYLGGSGSDSGLAIAADAAGNAFVAGQTGSGNFPGRATGRFFGQTGVLDAFILKLNPTGSALVYASFFGGINTDVANALTIDTKGNAYFAGRTDSPFLAVSGFQQTRAGSPAYRTTNRGESWEKIQENLLAPSVLSYAIDPVNPQLIYAGTNSTGIYKSFNGGNTWARFSQNNPLVNFVNVMAIDPKTPEIVYVGTNLGFLKSTDSGNTFALKQTGLGTGAINAIALDPNTPSTIYAATTSGVYKSTNGGEIWSAVNTGLSINPPFGPTTRATKLVIDPTNPQIIYAGTVSGLFKTVNGGANWTRNDATLPGNSLGSVNISALAIDPQNPSIVYAGTATFSGSLHKSTNGGTTWTQIASGLQSARPFTVNTTAIVVDPMASGTVFVATSAGVFKSVDGGSSWAISNQGLANVSVQALVMHPTNPNTLLAGTISAADAFVAKLDATGDNLLWATFLGGDENEEARAIAVDANENVYVTGQTTSTNFPTEKPFQATVGGVSDVFLTKINSQGTALVYSTYLGGVGGETARGLAVNALGEAYLAGTTNSADFPVLNSLQPYNKGVQDIPFNDAFVTRFKADGSGLIYSTFLGGSNNDFANGLVLDTKGNVYLTGSTQSTDFPLLIPVQEQRGDQSLSFTDAFVTKINPTGTALLYSTYLGGAGNDISNSIAVDSKGQAFVTGNTVSNNFPLVNPLRTRTGVFTDTEIFVAQVGINSDVAITLTDVPDAVMLNNPLTYTLTVTNNGPDPASDVTVTNTLPSSVTYVSAQTSQGSCTGTGPITCQLGEMVPQATVTMTVVVTPTQLGTITTQASVSSTTSDLTTANNMATQQTEVTNLPSLFGQIATANGAGVAGVTINLSGASTGSKMTGADGRFQFAKLPLGTNYVITPTRPGYVFNPPSRAVNNLTGDQQLNFTAVGCVASLTPANQSVGASGGIINVQLTYPDAQCPWIALSQVPWIQIISTSTGNGSATLILNVNPTTTARMGTVRIGENLFTVWQEVNPGGAPSFVATANFPAGKAPSALVKGDFNNDGKPDLAVGTDDSKIAILLSDGQGNFSTPEYFNSWGAPTSLTTADLNKDGQLDLIATIYSRTENVVVLLGIGGGKFGNYSLFSAGPLPNFIAVTDFNRDGRADLAVTNGDGHNVSLLLGKGDGTFNSAIEVGGVNTTHHPTQIVAADFNQDTKPDLAVRTSLGVIVFYGDGVDGVVTGQTFSTLPTTSGLIAADFNKDGRPDVALGTSINGRVALSIYLSNTSGFAAPINVILNAAPDIYGGGISSLKVGDFNKDGHSDLLAVLPNTYALVPLVGDGQGNFAVTGYISNGLYPRETVIDDFTGDGNADLVVTTEGRTYGSGLISLLQGKGTGEFNGIKNYAAPLSPTKILTADFDGDGKLDLLTLGGGCLSDPCANKGMVSLRVGKGNGDFREPTTFEVGNNPLSVVAGHFNADGKLDLAVTNNNSNTVSILLANGTGGFAAATDLPVSAKPRSIAAGDFNGDGKTDLVVSHLPFSLDNKLSILLGDGQGGFGAPTLMSIALPLFSLTVGDLNHDGKLDIVGSPIAYINSVSDADAGIYVLFGKGDGTFVAPRKYAQGMRALSFVLFDFNADGWLDLATVASDKLTLFLGDGTGNLATPSLFPLTLVPSSFSPSRELVLGDFNGDGKPDLAVTNGTYESVEILTGNGLGRFSAPVSFIIGSGTYSLAVGDYNADGLPDIASANYGSSIVSVLLNNTRASNLVTTVSGASYLPAGALTSDGIASAFGVGLSTATASAATLPLPTTLGGVSVKVKDRNGVEYLAPLFYVSPTQVNYLMPSGLAVGGAIVTIIHDNMVVSTGPVTIETIAPGLFTANADGVGPAAANLLRIKPNGDRSYEQIYNYDAVQKRYLAREITIGGDELFLELYGTGIRQNISLGTIQAKIGGIAAPVSYAGAQCCFVGVDQVNIKIPAAVAGKGLVNIELIVEGKPANIVQLNVK